MRKLLALLPLLLFLFLGSKAFSQNDAPPGSTPAQTIPSQETVKVMGLDPSDPKLYIDGNTPETHTVKIEFLGLAPKEKDSYWLFRKTNQDEARGSKDLKQAQPDANGKIERVVCGDGKDKLKGKDVKNNKECKEGSDFFHEGSVYRLGLYDDQYGEAQVMVGDFYVRHSYPKIRISTTRKDNRRIINVALSGRRSGGDSKNNYQLVLEGVGFKSRECFATREGEKTVSSKPLLGGGEKGLELLKLIVNSGEDLINPNATGFLFSDFGFTPIYPGKYLLKISEETNDTGIGGLADCGGGFTYAHIYFDLIRNKKTGEMEIKIDWDKSELDPNGVDFEKLEELSTFAPIPCAELEGVPDPTDPKKPRMCKKVRTAIGLIDVSAEGFVNSLFRFVLVIAGFGAIIIIIYSGYVLATSQGNKEKIAAARETLTSAILGLLFIIFSIVILEIIGVDILRIPGLTR